MMLEDREILNELRDLQKDNQNWRSNISKISEKLGDDYSDEVKAKALWMLGEIGLRYPKEVKGYVEEIVKFIDDENPKLRERSVNALGRIGRSDKDLIIPYFDKLMKTSWDSAGDVRFSFVWACENIATNSPELFCDKLDLFYELISDSYEKVRMESPEMFRVMGKRKPRFVQPYLEKLQYFAQNDKHPIVRIHCKGAVRITTNALNENQG